MGRRGAVVVGIHQKVVGACKAAELAGWDLLGCIVDGMQVAYGKITPEEFRKRQPEITIPEVTVPAASPKKEEEKAE